MAEVSVIILTFNEERHIGRAIRSVSAFAGRVIVVDSYSTDKTCEIARSLGAEVLQRRFVTQAEQFQWALDNIEINSEWVMRLDADEIISVELAQEIVDRLDSLAANITGVKLKRRHIFMGKWIRHGGRYPLLQLRLWRKGAARVERRWMDEHIVLLYGESLTFSNDFSDWNLSDLNSFIKKHNNYATREAIEFLGNKYRLFKTEDDIAARNPNTGKFLSRVAGKQLYNRLPLWCGPISYFLYRYIILLGFLDGVEGVVYHFLQCLWYRFLVGVKIEEYERRLRLISSNELRRTELARMTGYSADQFMDSK